MIQCTKCEKYKPEDCFVRDRKRHTGRYAWCKECTTAIRQQRRERSEVSAPAELRCNRCHETKPLIEENFGRCKSNTHGFQYECKLCKRARRNNAHHQGTWNEPDRLHVMKANGPMEKITYPAIFDRDLGICGVCNEAVDPELPSRHPQSGSIDHIVPISAGGTHTFDNVQLAHLYCNYEKGVRVA